MTIFMLLMSAAAGQSTISTQHRVSLPWGDFAFGATKGEIKQTHPTPKFEIEGGCQSYFNVNYEGQRATKFTFVQAKKSPGCAPLLLEFLTKKYGNTRSEDGKQLALYPLRTLDLQKYYWSTSEMKITMIKFRKRDYSFTIIFERGQGAEH